jgi:hypothetical protein
MTKSLLISLSKGGRRNQFAKNEMKGKKRKFRSIEIKLLKASSCAKQFYFLMNTKDEMKKFIGEITAEKKHEERREKKVFNSITFSQ